MSCGILLSILNIMGHNTLYFVDFTKNDNKHDIASKLLFVISLITNILSWVCIFKFGLGGFENLKLTGKYAVGHKLYYASTYGAPTSIFYPVDKMHEQLVI